MGISKDFFLNLLNTFLREKVLFTDINSKYIVFVDKLHAITLVEIRTFNVVNRFKNPLENSITSIKILKAHPHILLLSDEYGKIFEADALFGKILKVFQVKILY